MSAQVWRVVEDQFQSSTLKLVETVQEQNVLEEILDDLAKPPQPTDPEFGGLHFLLSTPFRYPPFHGGSRFATRSERGLWYGALEVTTALVEKAYYRFVFLLGTAADLGTVEQPWSSFSVTAKSKRAVDLTAAPFLTYQSQISSPTSYAFSQPLGRAMRQDGVALCKFTSARDQAQGVNVALFAPAFDSRQVAESTHVGWMSRSTRQVVQIYRKDFARPPKTVLEYPRQYFEVGGVFSAPALSR